MASSADIPHEVTQPVSFAGDCVSRSTAAIPRPNVLWAALFTTTETLARELADPTDRAPAWTDFEWRIAQAAAAIHGISPLLASSLRWRGPEGWATFLAEQRTHVTSRHSRIADLLAVINTKARCEGIELIALKGAALHEMGIYRAGDRPMADVDLLVRPASVDATARLLAALGYEQCGATWKHRIFLPPGAQASRHGENCGNAIKIELHCRLIERLPLSEVDISELIYPKHLCPGLNYYRSRACLMIHLLHHAAGAMSGRALRVIHLHDIALLATRLTAVDWEELTTQSADDQRLWWALPPLTLTARYYPNAIPPGALEAIRPSCSRMLARISRRATISQVSLSYPWVDALPALGWSTSIRESLSYILSRVRPPDWRTSEHRYAAKAELWATENSWYELSQFRRVLRWMVRRPPRAQTMHAVRAALARSL